MKKMILAVVSVLMLIASNSYATEPVKTTIGFINVTYPTSSSTRANMYVRFNDAADNFIFEPATMVQIWANSSCGTASTTVTVGLHNGITVVMKKGLDYTFFVPLIWSDWTVDINAKIIQPGFLSETGCFHIQGYGPNAQGLPGGF